MHWLQRWPESLLTVLLFALEAPQWSRTTSSTGLARASWTAAEKVNAREKTRDLWYHGFGHYMMHAFPMDELRPLTCTGRGPDWNDPHNIATNDVAGNFSVTLVDVLDTFVVLNDRPGFEAAVRNVIDWVSFNVNTKPQVFETTIRVLGGLLSAHIFASDADHPFHLRWYRGELLDMAHDLGNRLLPAFSTPTGIPLARLNLRFGVQAGETWDTCTAGAGSLMLEFATLSRLTGDDRFEKAAYKAFFAIWNRRSDISLVGNTINAKTGMWTSPQVTGIGAGIDSFYEYALKWYILSGDIEFLDVWHEAYAAIMRYSRAADGFWYRSVNIHTGDVAYWMSDSLSAFWPGLQVLGGDIQNAIKSHLIYWNIWKRFSGLPEVFDINFRVATSLQYPLRPELIESTWYLYRATRDEFYLDVGERILNDLTWRAQAECGLTGIMDLRDNTQDDRMESFVLSETLKYLFLLFDEENSLHRDDSNFVFTTEGHILSLNRDHLKPLSTVRRKLRRVENLQCPAYCRPVHVYDDWDAETGLVGGIMSRPDIDYVRNLVGTAATRDDEDAWSQDGWCEAPKLDLYSYDFVLSPDGHIVPEDTSPNIHKILPVSDGYVILNISGIRAHIVSRLDGRGYDVTKLGPHAVRTGQTVYVNDTALSFLPSLRSQGGKDSGSRSDRDPDIQMRLFVDAIEPVLQLQPGMQDLKTEITVTGYTALFAGNPASPARPDEQPLHFGHGAGVPVMRDAQNPLGCDPYTQRIENDAVVVVGRGGCTFLEKLAEAQEAGASGVITINHNDTPINPSADVDEMDEMGRALDDVAMVVVSSSDGNDILAMIDAAERRGLGQVILAVEPEGRSGTTDAKEETSSVSNNKRGAGNISRDVPRVLYINGHPLLNTKLLI